MIISGKPVQQIGRIYQEQTKVGHKPDSPKPSKGQDKVTLSSESKELNAIFQQVYAPEEISAKAQELKEAVSTGTYKVSGEDIATSMLKYMKQKV